MSRYIDADKLILHFKLMAEDEWNESASPSSWSQAFRECIDEIENLPTADVEEVRHGEWRLIEEDADGNGNNQYKCSLCEAGEIHAPFTVVQYCWKCGAKWTGMTLLIANFL